MLAATGDLVAAEIALRRSCAPPRARRSGVRSWLLGVRASRRWSPRSSMRCERWTCRRRAGSRQAKPSCCASSRSKTCSAPATWWWTPAAARCVTPTMSSRWRGVRCCSASRAPWPRPGRRTSPRDELIARVFEARRPNESHRIRLRVEVGRLRKELRQLAGVRATTHGFVLDPLGARSVVVLAPPVDGEDTMLLALLADGAAWSTSALALALAASQRTVQRALSRLEAAGRVRSLGRARAQRWLAPPVVGFTTTLLLPSSLAEG